MANLNVLRLRDGSIPAAAIATLRRMAEVLAGDLGRLTNGSSGEHVERTAYRQLGGRTNV